MGEIDRNIKMSGGNWLKYKDSGVNYWNIEISGRNWLNRNIKVKKGKK